MTTLTRAQVREIDRRAIEEFGVPGIVLMENAGRGAAEVLMRLNPERRPVLVMCGKGNNGGDGFVIARHLDIHGWPVVVGVFAAPDDYVGDAAINYGIVTASRIPFVHSVDEHSVADKRTLKERIDASRPQISMMGIFANRPTWIVDALFGTGLNGPIRGHLGNMVERLGSSIKPGEKILAVDIPSGLDCDTGKPLGPCVRADHTVTFVAPKAGFANPDAKEWLGEVHVVGIGAPRKLLEQYGLDGSR